MAAFQLHEILRHFLGLFAQPLLYDVLLTTPPINHFGAGVSLLQLLSRRLLFNNLFSGDVVFSLSGAIWQITAAVILNRRTAAPDDSDSFLAAAVTRP